jgi:myo-inositol-1(or 4)-monophosphatase
MDACLESAQAAGQVLLDRLGKVSVRQKGPGDLVTEADFAAQQCIREIVTGRFPAHGFIGEEGPAATADNAEFVWYVDPLDGTTNYVHGLKHFAVSIGIARRGELVCGVVFDPTVNECFAAEQGAGATLNGQPIRTSAVTELSDALVAVSLPVHSRRGEQPLEQVLDVVAIAPGVRRLGSAALNMCYVAAGRVDAYWDVKANAWDVAAGVVIVREAGGVVTSLNGGAFTLDRPAPVAAGTEQLHRQLLDLLGKHA